MKMVIACLAVLLVPTAGYACENITLINIKETCQGKQECLEWFAEVQGDRLRYDSYAQADLPAGGTGFIGRAAIFTSKHISRRQRAESIIIQNTVLLLGWDNSQKQRQAYPRKIEQITKDLEESANRLSTPDSNPTP